MLAFPHTSASSRSNELIEEVLALSKALESMPVSGTTKRAIFHSQYLKSSLFSARIEGNTLVLGQLTEAEVLSPKEKQKREVGNILKALGHLSVWETPLTIGILQEIHAIVMNGLDSAQGKMRNEQSAIFDGQGSAVYVTPDPQTVHDMLSVLIAEWEKQRSMRGWLQNLGSFHYYFEKIHPFLDGNGRVGRILLHLTLAKAGLEKGYVLPIDQYIDEHRGQYYTFLEKNTRNVEDLEIFLLEGVIWSINAIFTDLKQSDDGQLHKTEGLLPRRSEIIAILRDHPLASLDFIARRFPTIPRRTLAYDMAWLVNKKLVMKYGQTRGVLYSACNS